MGPRNAGQPTTPHDIPASLRAAIRKKLLTWFTRHRRDLPWRRKEKDPYAQWVAEIMLQQTRVDTVLPYYERFLKRFPTVACLARARHETVLKHWEGLGYYRRALHLHNGAKLLVREGPAMPRSAAELLRVPGIGKYTAAAIASIAFGERVAAVDGNVARVVARLFAVRDNVLAKPGIERIERLASQLVPPGRPGDFNQAWMDLGSAICTPRQPDCASCPLRTICLAHTHDLAETIPVRIPKTKVERQFHAVGVFAMKNRMLVRKRPTGGLWSGLWEFPTRQVPSPRTATTAIHELLADCGLAADSPVRDIGRIRHRLTHRALTFAVRACHVHQTGSQPLPAAACWKSFRQFEALSVSAAHRRISDLVVRAQVGA